MTANTFVKAVATWRLCVLATVLLGIVSCAAVAGTTISRVDVANTPEKVSITVQGTGPLKVSTIQSPSGKYIGFQFASKMLVKGKLMRIGDGGILSLRYSNFREYPPATRIVLNTDTYLNYSTRWNDDKSRLIIDVWKKNASRSVVGIKVNNAEVTKVLGITQTVANEPLPTIPATACSINKVDINSEPSIKHCNTKVEPVRVAFLPSEPSSVLTINKTDEDRKYERKVSLDFLAADINDVLKALAVQSGENIVSGKDVTGSITLSLKNVTVEEALDYIAKLSGYSYAKSGNTYIVGSREAVFQSVKLNLEMLSRSYRQSMRRLMM